VRVGDDGDEQSGALAELDHVVLEREQHRVAREADEELVDDDLSGRDRASQLPLLGGVACPSEAEHLGLLGQIGQRTSDNAARLGATEQDQAAGSIRYDDGVRLPRRAVWLR
jgi:hypothetical protein